jgi:transposase
MAPWLFAAAYAVFERLQHIWADMASRGQRLRTGVEEQCGWTLDIVERPRRWGGHPSDVEPPPMPAFTVLPRRWVVERTLAWIGRYRRLSKDDEDLPESREAMIDFAMPRLMRRRLPDRPRLAYPARSGRGSQGSHGLSTQPLVGPSPYEQASTHQPFGLEGHFQTDCRQGRTHFVGRK